MEVSIIEVTPEVAKKYLQMNSLNRPLDGKVVDEYCVRFKKGIWGDDSDPIRIDKKGELLNGQHRLTAIMKTGVKISMILVSDLENDAFKTMDNGKRRTASDVLGIHGVRRNTAAFSSVLSLICEYKATRTLTNSNTFRRREMTGARLIQEWEALGPEKQAFLGEVAKAAALSKGAGVSKTILATVGFVFGKDALTHFKEFCKMLRSGEGLTSTMGVYHLRERMMGLKAKKMRISFEEQAAIVIKAFESFYRGKPVKVLRWSETEAFPTISV